MFSTVDGEGFKIFSTKDSYQKIHLYTNEAGNEVYLRLGAGDQSGYNYFMIKKTTSAVEMYYYQIDGTPVGFQMDYATGDIKVHGKLKAATSSDRIYATFA